MSGPLLVVIVAMCGLALDAGRVYNRQVELSGMARAVALDAAKQLDGTTTGIAAAQAAAAETANRFKYKYGLSIIWQDSALKFSTASSRSGTWMSGASVADAPTVQYVKVDTADLAPEVGKVETMLIHLFTDMDRTVVINGSAVAGRTGVDVVPIAICAMSDSPAAERENPDLADKELVEYGFRRGVSYDLMQLNPKAKNPARFLINPIAAPGTTGQPFNTSVIPPFACVGTTWLPSLSGGLLRVSPLPDTSPLNAIYTSLNSRFDTYTLSSCHHSSAPPDANVKPYPYDKTGGAPWMLPATGKPAAFSTTERGWLETIADIPSPGTNLQNLSAGSYGPLWSYAKAVKYAAYVQGDPEPDEGYATFALDDWGKLYTPSVSAKNYPQVYSYSTPYNPVGTANPTTAALPASARKEFATASRRVLHIPLLSCSAGVPSGSNSSATLAGIGKFFMTVPATKDYLIGEFAGTVPESSLSGPVELFP